MKSIFAVIALAAILSLSAFFAYAYAAEENKAVKVAKESTGKPDTSKVSKCEAAPAGCDEKTGKVTPKFQPDKGFIPQRVEKDKGGDGVVDDIHRINGLFRNHKNHDDGLTALDNIPVVQPLNVTNGTATATVTIPVCDGVVAGPCLDPTSHVIVP